MSKATLAVVLIVVVCSAAGGAAFYLTRDNGESLVYEQKAVERADVESIVNATGALEPVNTVVVGTEVSGQISELFVDFNDTVEQGQVIARIDPRTFEARHLQREADVEVATANIASRQAEMRRAKSNLQRALSEQARREELSVDGLVSESQLELDKNAVDQAKASLAIAESSLKNAKAGLTQANAALAQSELDLERTQIRTPISGTVIDRAVEIGQTVAASFSAPELFTIAHDLHQMKVEASVDEADVGRLEDGLPARFTVDAYPEREFRGRVTQIRKSPSQNQNVVTYKVIVTARNDDLALFPGMTANVEMVLGSRDDVLTVPNSALRYRPRGESAENQMAQSSARGGGQQRGGRPPTAEDSAARLKEQLGLDDEQEQKAVAVYNDLSQKMRGLFMSMASRGGGGPPGRGGGSDMRQRMSNLMEHANKEILEFLNAEQREKFEIMLASMSGNRQTVYTLAEDGTEVQKSIVVGLQDDNVAEVLSGLEEGDSVIVRVRRVTS